jgi:methionyl-tRNA synthetase
MAFGQDAIVLRRGVPDALQRATSPTTLGNTVSRVAALCRQSFGGTPNELCTDNEVMRAFGAAQEEWQAAMEDCQFHRALEAVWKLLAQINGYVVAKEPWKIRKSEGADARACTAFSRRRPKASASPRHALSVRAFDQPEDLRDLRDAGKDPDAADLAWGRLPVSRPMPDLPALFPRADAAEYFRTGRMSR